MLDLTGFTVNEKNWSLFLFFLCSAVLEESMVAEEEEVTSSQIVSFFDV